MTVQTITYHSTKEIKELITKEGIRNQPLVVSIIGYVSSGVSDFPIEQEYYQVYVRDLTYDFDKAVIETTSLAKANQRAVQIMNALDGYRGNNLRFEEFDNTFTGE